MSHPYLVNATGLNHGLVKLARLLNTHGRNTTNERASKTATGGDMLEVKRVLFSLSNPMDTALNVPGRNNNIYAMMAETIWVLAGEDKINPYLTYFLPRAPMFSDDGETWRGAYGPRLYIQDQLTRAVELLRKDPTTRQAIVGIYSPELDSPAGIKESTGKETTVDFPCNNLLYFDIETVGGVKKLNITVVQRSGDWCWGMGSINVFEWTALQRVVADLLNVEMGMYTHYVNNLHIYESNAVAYSQFREVLSIDEDYLVTSSNDFKCDRRLMGMDMEEVREWCQAAMAGLTQLIEGEPKWIEPIEFTGSWLDEWSKVLLNYILARRSPEEEISVKVHMHPSWIKALKTSRFTPKNLIIEEV